MGQANEEVKPEFPWVKCLSCGFGASHGSYDFMRRQSGLEADECPLCGRPEMAQTSYHPLEIVQ